MPEHLQPERTSIGNIGISRILTGLWQVADIEKDGTTLDPESGADHLQAYVRDGFDTFDMADHYGSSEIIAGRLLRRYRSEPARPVAFTKWCPAPGPMTAGVVRAGIQERLDRLGVDRIDLLQFHWWRFDHLAWLDALHELSRLREEGLIRELGVTNFDAAHLHLALADGVPLVSNQVSFSLLDRRAAGPLADVCRAHGIKLLAYGTLCGGFLSDKWLDRSEPDSILDWSGMKYRRFIDTIGGWDIFQGVLGAISRVAKRHGVSVSNVATRWVLEHPHVAGIIVGARLGESEHRDDNLKLFDFSLDDEDRSVLDAALGQTRPIPGDCGDEYRRPPYLTASGDLSHHLSSLPTLYKAEPVPGRPGRRRVLSGSQWEPIAGHCRAVQVGDRIMVSGTTATAGKDRIVAPGNAAGQATYIIDKIAAALAALGGSIEDVVRTRVVLQNVDDTLPVSLAHGRVFGTVMPANTLFQIGSLVGDYLVEIDADAITDPQNDQP